MKKMYFSIAAAALLLASCTQQRYATNGVKYENDEAYYQPGEHYISDFALVDDEAQMDNTTPSEDYVDPNLIDNNASNNNDPLTDDYYNESGGVVNNYYGNVYQSPYGSNWNGYFGNPYGNNGFLTWNPFYGWRYRYYWGLGWGNYCAPYFGYWYSPWNDPWYWNTWCWNDPYDPWGWNYGYYGWYGGFGYTNGFCYNGWYGNPYYNTWNGNYWMGNNWNNDSNVGLGTVYGPRPSISVGSSVNSSYDNATLRPLALHKPAQLGGTTTPNVGLNPALKPSGETASFAGISHEESKNMPSESATSTLALTEKKPIQKENSNIAKPAIVPSEKKPESETEITRPNKPVVTDDEKPVLASNKDSDYYTMPRPKPGTKNPRPAYVAPYSGNGNSRDQSATSTHRENVNANTTGRNNGNFENSRENSRRPFSNDNGFGTTPSRPLQKDEKPAFRQPEMKPADKPAPVSRPSDGGGGNISPSRSGGSGSAGSSSSGGGRSSGGSGGNAGGSAGGARRK